MVPVLLHALLVTGGRGWGRRTMPIESFRNYGIYNELEEGKDGELYWISSGKKTWFKKFASILQKQTNCGIKFPETPRYTKKVDVGNFVVDNSKLKKLGWKPRVDINSGIKKTIEYFNSK